MSLFDFWIGFVCGVICAGPVMMAVMFLVDTNSRWEQGRAKTKAARNAWNEVIDRLSAEEVHREMACKQSCHDN